MQKWIMPTLVIPLSLLLSGISAFDKLPPDAAPKWSTGCEASKADQFGDPKRQHCYLMLNNLHHREQLMEDNSYVIRLETLILVDKNGLRLDAPRKSSSLCKNEPRRIAVDGQRIDQLPAAQQIERIIGGRTLVWEKQADWPYCGIAPHGTNLHGIGPAITKLQQEWAAISNGWATTVGR